MTLAPQSTPAYRFATTHWSVVLNAVRQSDTGSREALEVLCQRYWLPLYTYVRRRGHSAEDAQDSTQEFFARMLEHNWLVRADKGKGRFRTFLLTVMQRFLANEWDKVRTQKRGGNVHLESLSEVAESRLAQRATTSFTPDLEFEREWALAVLEHALCALEKEYADAGKAELFANLQQHLVMTRQPGAYVDAAAELQMSEAAYKMSVSRIRRRYREQLRMEVAATVANPADIEPELRHLFRILTRTR